MFFYGLLIIYILSIFKLSIDKIGVSGGYSSNDSISPNVERTYVSDLENTSGLF